jgi:hypothetical protein
MLVRTIPKSSSSSFGFLSLDDRAAGKRCNQEASVARGSVKFEVDTTTTTSPDLSNKIMNLGWCTPRLYTRCSIKDGFNEQSSSANHAVRDRGMCCGGMNAFCTCVQNARSEYDFSAALRVDEKVAFATGGGAGQF